MKAQSSFLVFLLLTNLLRGQEPAPRVSPAVRVSVIAGDHTKNKIGQPANIDPVVQVDDETGKAIVGASVVFSLPADGPGGAFESGDKTLTVTSDAQGHASAHGIRANRQKGKFEIHVTASYEGRTANVTISEINTTRDPGEKGAFGISTKTWVIAGVLLLAIAGGIFAAKEIRSHNNGNVLTATPGVPVVGGPQ